MSMKSDCSKAQSALGGALLALLVVSILALPAGEMAQGWAATPASSSDGQTAMALTAAPSPVIWRPSLKPFDFRPNGNSPFSFIPPPTESATGHGAKEFSFNPRGSAAFPLFNAKPLFDQATNGAQSAENSTPVTKHSVRKKYLALGILGALGAAGGAAAVAGSNSVCTTNNLGNNGTAKSICSNVHTAGEVMIPTGAAVAVLGFYLAFKHH
jgi:hypothetical protein